MKVLQIHHCDYKKGIVNMTIFHHLLFAETKSCLPVCPDSRISYGNIKSRILHLKRLDFCCVKVGQVKNQIAPPCHCKSNAALHFLTHISHAAATPPCNTLGVGHVCALTLGQARAEPVKSLITYKDCCSQEQMLTELLPTAP